MKLKFGGYLLTTGWGGEGFYDLDKAIGVTKEGIYIIPDDAVICGTGSGYEEFIFQRDICDMIVRYMDGESQEHE